MEEFEQESMMKHTFEDILNVNTSNLTIKYTRVLNDNVKLPKNKQELNRTLEISQRVETFIHANNPV